MLGCMAVRPFANRIECSFRREHRLIMVCFEIAPNHNAFYGWHRRANHVMDVRQKLSNGDLTFLNILWVLGLSITVSN